MSFIFGLVDFLTANDVVDPMSTLLTTLGTVVTQILTWVGSVATTIVDTPLLLLTTGFLVLGGAIGIFGCLLSKG